MTYDEVYTIAVPAYKEAVDWADSQAESYWADQIINEASTLVKVVVSRNWPSVTDPHLRQTLIDEGLLSILSMAYRYDPTYGITFSQWISSTKAEWKVHLYQTLSTQLNNSCPQEGRAVLAAAAKLKETYLLEHGNEPDIAWLDEQVQLHFADRIAEINTQVAQGERKNKGALEVVVKNFKNLYLLNNPVPVDTIEDNNDITPEFDEQLLAAFDSWLGEDYTGDKESKRLAKLISSPVNQWTHLQPLVIYSEEELNPYEEYTEPNTTVENS